MNTVSISSLKIGFILSHPFHISIYKNIAKHFRFPTFVIETRKKQPFTFNKDFIDSIPGDVVMLDTDELILVDGMLDVVFTLTPIHVLKMFRQTKVIALQYSLAKEVYQYGLWRSIADLNIVFGPYSFDRVKGHCVAAIGGNPRFDGIARETQGGDGLLYMPTYGELSSLKVFLEALPSLPNDLRIKVKTHHASEFTDQDLIRQIARDKRVQIIDGYGDGLKEIAAADMVLSDYSGSLFDALYLGKPVALIQTPFQQSKERTAAESIEIARADEIGPVAREVGELAAALERASGSDWTDSRRKLVDELFAHQGASAPRIATIVEELVAGGYRPPLPIKGIRDTYQNLVLQNRTLRKELAGARKIRVPGSGKAKKKATSATPKAASSGAPRTSRKPKTLTGKAVRQVNAALKACGRLLRPLKMWTRRAR